MPGTSKSGSTTSSPACGPNARAVATPRLSSTTGDGVTRASPSYSAVIRSQSVSSATVARAWQAAIAACSAYGPTVPPQVLDRLDVRESATDQQPVPPRAVLVEQQHRLTVRPGTCPEPGRLDLDQREQAERLGVARGQGSQHPSEPERLRAEVAADPLLAAGRGVALVEDQVDDLPDGIEASGPFRPGGKLEADVRGRQRALGPDDALGDGRHRGQEGASDLVGAQATDQLEGQRRARVRREDRVAGHEDQPEQVVGEVAVDDLVEVGLARVRLWTPRPVGTCPAGCRGAGSGRRPGSSRSCSTRPPGCPARRPAATSRSPRRRCPGPAPRRCRGRRPDASVGRSPAGTRPATASRPRSSASSAVPASSFRRGRSWLWRVGRRYCPEGPRTRRPGVRRPARCRRAGRTCERARRPRRASRPRGSRSRR